MTRVEECTKAISEMNEAMDTLTNRVAEPGFSVEPGEYLMVAYEVAKVSMLMEIAKGLAYIADKCDE